MAPRAVRRPLVMKRWEIGALAGATAVTGAAVWARVMYLLYSSETLYLPALRPVYGFVRSYL